MEAHKMKVLMQKIFTFIGYGLIGLVFLVVVVGLLMASKDRMDTCLKQDSTSYCVMTQQKFVFWDMVNPLSDKK
jgi:hypothetical protein